MTRSCECIRWRRWEIVLVLEIKSVSYGTMWIGEGRSQMVILYSRKTYIIMRRGMMRRWNESGQKWEHGEKTTMVAIEAARFVILPCGQIVSWWKAKEQLLVGDYFNAQIPPRAPKAVRREGSVAVFGLPARRDKWSRSRLNWLWGGEPLLCQ